MRLLTGKRRMLPAGNEGGKSTGLPYAKLGQELFHNWFAMISVDPLDQ